jgi:hypothetical protein
MLPRHHRAVGDLLAGAAFIVLRSRACWQMAPARSLSPVTTTPPEPICTTASKRFAGAISMSHLVPLLEFNPSGCPIRRPRLSLWIAMKGRLPDRKRRRTDNRNQSNSIESHPEGKVAILINPVQPGHNRGCCRFEPIMFLSRYSYSPPAGADAKASAENEPYRQLVGGACE